jgi:hypothetical protein
MNKISFLPVSRMDKEEGVIAAERGSGERACTRGDHRHRCGFCPLFINFHDGTVKNRRDINVLLRAQNFEIVLWAGNWHAQSLQLFGHVFDPPIDFEFWQRQPNELSCQYLG